jgi:hypothetical protein
MGGVLMATYTYEELVQWFDEKVKQYDLDEAGWVLVRQIITERIERDRDGV